ncbi:MAG: hypothetical protein AVDCRST_MAG90-2542 [uncultured Microvirga sp.]|uniref:Uncharacterized protein n=1 Tax=uncultured Microvirga sp. TaxID=412392 RepID=A0A6J4M992_9HYPH|nr:MAG: hypothetical protein AVDCRST_MAG90-2542 [uncultured Microvirga sp.]
MIQPELPIFAIHGQFASPHDHVMRPPLEASGSAGYQPA